MTLQETRALTTRDGLTLLARRLTEGDGRALQDFNRGLGPGSEQWFRAHAYDDATVRKALARSCAGDDLTLGVFDGDRMVGYFFLWYFREPVPLLGIGLQDDYQERGLGRQMMGLLVDAAKAAGRNGIELTTNIGNDRAFALYRKAGFRHYGDVAAVQGDGTVLTEHGMYYAIKPGSTPPAREHRPPV
jgi:ribosomal protein S18 acetylase RimI-like enzyme